MRYKKYMQVRQLTKHPKMLTELVALEQRAANLEIA